MNNVLDGSNRSRQKGKAALGGRGLVLATHRFISFLVCAAMMSIFARATFSQSATTDADRAQLLQSQTQPPFGTSGLPEGVEDGHAAASPNDADIGEQEILKRATQYQPLTLLLASPIFYTSNVALTRSGEKSDVVIAPTVGAYYDPQITKTLYGHFGAREQVFYYGDNTGFDFGSLDVEAGLNYLLPQFHNLILGGEYDFNRLTFDDRLGDEFFST